MSSVAWLDVSLILSAFSNNVSKILPERNEKLDSDIFCTSPAVFVSSSEMSLKCFVESVIPWFKLCIRPVWFVVAAWISLVILKFSCKDWVIDARSVAWLCKFSISWSLGGLMSDIFLPKFYFFLTNYSLLFVL